jgi:hypothetical protein
VIIKEHRIWWEILLSTRNVDSYSAGQVISRLLWKTKVHYCAHKGPALGPVLSQLNPTYILTAYIFKDQFHYYPPISCPDLQNGPILSVFLYLPPFGCWKFMSLSGHNCCYLTQTTCAFAFNTKTLT